MTDNEIIQEATEAVTQGYPCAFLVSPLLDVIERKNAEIEKLQEHIKHTNNVVKQVVTDAKSEAYREFAHMVVDKAENGIIYATDISDYVVEFTESNE